MSETFYDGLSFPLGLLALRGVVSRSEIVLHPPALSRQREKPGDEVLSVFVERKLQSAILVHPMAQECADDNVGRGSFERYRENRSGVPDVSRHRKLVSTLFFR